jgi:hypothetical protein
MADPARATDTDDGRRVGPGGESTPRTPRWVIVLGIIALILILAVAAQFVLGLQHGPGLHGAS